MTLSTTTQVRVARLHRDKTALYQRIHDEMTADHAVATLRAYERIDIYRLDDFLVMLTEIRPGPQLTPTAEDDERAARWHASLTDCFAEPWRQADPMFLLSLAVITPTVSADAALS